jgi:hypothetical protein
LFVSIHLKPCQTWVSAGFQSLKNVDDFVSGLKDSQSSAVQGVEFWAGVNACKPRYRQRKK